ncbi:MAG TPA: glycosyltransferase, partial [Gammaproteobacteria bacterium]|nr:glycosyltransferase [Gammaproteobacteria bacterium]
KILARFSHKVLEGFPRSFPAKISTQVIGNPVREGFYHVAPPAQRIRDSDPRLKILVIGGSSGARALNDLLPQILQQWPNAVTPQIWHQAGKKNIADAEQAYAAAGFNVNINDQNSPVKLVDFIHDMPAAYSWADVIICRSGALTVAEIAAVGVASILIPYPYAVDDHQTKNAHYLADAGAAVIIQERDLQAGQVIALLQDLQVNPAKIQAMAQAAYSMAKPEALDLVVQNLAL